MQQTIFKKLQFIIPRLSVFALALSLGLPRHLRADVVVEPPGATVAGKTISEWTAAWWQWAVALAPPGDPFTDTTGAFAGVNQSGPVFFLAGSPGGTRSRQFTVPPDVYVLVPLLAGEWSQLELGFDKTAAYIRQAAQQQANQINSLHATMDGVAIPQATLFTHRQASPDFSFVSVAGNSVNVPAGASGIAVADGYFLMLQPLSPGTHVLTYGGGSSILGIFISETDTITVYGPPPSITTQPADQAAAIGAVATFRVSATTTNPPLRFQWQFNGTNVFQATNDTLTISNVQVENLGEYRVIVSDSVGFTNSASAYLTPLNFPPYITTQPTNFFARAGSDATLEVNAGGATPLIYQWRLNGVNLGDATNSTLAITNVQSQHVGNYTVVITNNHGAVTSSTVALRLIVWERTYNGPFNNFDDAWFVAVDREGHVVATGVSCEDFSPCDYYTAKYSASDGTLLWERRYSGPGNTDDTVAGMAVDAHGDVVVTGSSGSYPTNDFYTVKYSGKDGAILWEKRYDGPGHADDYASGMALDANGDVVITGTCSSTNFNFDHCTIKYAAADGTLLWVKSYNDPANSNAEGRLVALDHHGNVVVAGVSYTAVGTSDYYTVKYAGTNGAFLWDRRYNGPANLDDYPTAMALDGNGNVVVTGASYASNLQPDYYTAKYSGTNGALMWERRYDGPGNDMDTAWGLALDNSGDVVVTGLSVNGAPNFDGDLYTLKYAAANGEILWSKRYNGPGNSYEGGRAVTVDDSGNILVLGHSGGDIYLVAYATTNGATLWDYRHTNSYASKLTQDMMGGIIFAGSSNSTDFLTVKLQAAIPEIVNSRITSITFFNSKVQLEWMPAPGVVLHQKPSLSAPDWQVVAGSQNTNRIAIPATNASGYFRLFKP